MYEQGKIFRMLMYYQEASYPERLKHCIGRPASVVFQSGNIDFQNRKTHKYCWNSPSNTLRNIEFTKKSNSRFGTSLNPIIVSGFAYGVDIVAHQAAMENNLQTIGVLAHGLNQIYPKMHQKNIWLKWSKMVGL